MKILGIDTTTKFLSLGVFDQGKIYEYNIDLGRKHSSRLMVTIKRIIEVLGWQLGEIDYLACGLGPGSFTGIRIGLAAIKGLSWSLEKPILGMSTLDILANAVKQADKYAVPIIDAKRNLIYTSIYKINNGALKRIAPYMLLREKDFFSKVKNNAVIFGDAVILYKEKILRQIREVTILDSDYWYPKGRNIIELAVERIRKKKLNNAFNIKPIYLYPKECQIKSSNS